MTARKLDLVHTKSSYFLPLFANSNSIWLLFIYIKLSYVEFEFVHVHAYVLDYETGFANWENNFEWIG